MKRLFALGVFLMAVSLAGASHAVGQTQLCARYGYDYVDQGLGEDYLLNGPQGWGAIPAAASWASLQRNGVEVWADYLDSEGCSNYVDGYAGWYLLTVYPYIWTTGGGILTTYPDNSYTWRVFYVYVWYPGEVPTGTQHSEGAVVGRWDPVASIAAVQEQLALKVPEGFWGGHEYPAFADQSCPGHSGAVSCNCITDGPPDCIPHPGVYIGPTWNAYKKFVIAHEIGHDIQEHLFGMDLASYEYDVSELLCRCDHVSDPNNREHCLQSREMSSAADTEGWGHFIATKIMNDPAHSTAVLGYYKEVLWEENEDPSTPPVPIVVYPDLPFEGQWQNTNCPSSQVGLGVESDWMRFFYSLHTRTTNWFSIWDIANVWWVACEFQYCTWRDATYEAWPQLLAAVNWCADNGWFRTGSGMANYWTTEGWNHGIDH